MNNEFLEEEKRKSNYSKEKKEIINSEKITLNSAVSDLKNLRYVFYVISAFSLIGIVFGLSTNLYKVTPLSIVIEGILLAGIYGIWGYFLPRNPKLFVLSGITIYILVMILSAAGDLDSLFQGVPIKVIFLFFLFRGLVSVFAFDRSYKKLELLGISERENKQIQNLEEVELS